MFMKIYVAHSKDFDYKNELYAPIRGDEKLKEHQIFLPHDVSASSSNTRDFYSDIDLMIAECSYPSTGLGIELGWAFDDHVPVFAIHKQGTKVSGSVYAVTDNIAEYTDSNDMLEMIRSTISQNVNHTGNHR